MKSSDRLVAIINPAAGRGRCRGIKRWLSESLDRDRWAFQIHETKEKGHAIELANAVADGTLVVAVGGDGTLNEVVRGLTMRTEDGQALPRILHLGYGSGNDFAQTHGTPLSTHELLKALAAPGPTLKLDLGVADLGPGGVVHFANSLGIGLEARAVAEAASISWARGRLLYLLGLLRALKDNTQPLMDVNWVNSMGEKRQRHERLSLVTFGNGPRSGGGLRLTPDAQADDGWLDIGLLGAMRRFGLLALLPQLLCATHGNNMNVLLDTCRHATVRSKKGLVVHVDGEVLPVPANSIEVKLQPKRLRIISCAH